MSTAVPTHVRHSPTASPWQALLAMLRGLTDRWALQRDHARAHFEFERMNAAMLRDLGITRSECGSFWAETRGLTEPTRVRVMRPVRRQDPH